MQGLLKKTAAAASDCTLQQSALLEALERLGALVARMQHSPSEAAGAYIVQLFQKLDRMKVLLHEVEERADRLQSRAQKCTARLDRLKRKGSE